MDIQEEILQYNGIKYQEYRIAGHIPNMTITAKLGVLYFLHPVAAPERGQICYFPSSC